MSRPSLSAFLRRHGVTRDSSAVDVYDTIEDYLYRYLLRARGWTELQLHNEVDELPQQFLCDKPLSIP